MEMEISRERTALVVIDMQRAFLEDEGSLAKAGIDIGGLKAALEPCQRLLASARQAGVPEDVVSAIATGKAPEGMSGIEASLVKYVHELSRNHKISDETFNAVRDHFGTEKTVGITALIGHYMLVGQILLAFEVDLPAGVQPEIT